MKRKKLEKMPLYQKAVSILEIVDRIVELVPEENEYLSDIAGYMYEDAMQLVPNIEGAMGSDLYDLKMENAAIIRKSAREVFISCDILVAEGFKEVEYLDILQDEIEEFRVLFAEWVKTFDQWSYLIDRWGLFNPPGVNFDDADPDENIFLNNFLEEMDDDEEEPLEFLEFEDDEDDEDFFDDDEEEEFYDEDNGEDDRDE